MPFVFVFDEGLAVSVYPTVAAAGDAIESADVADGFYRRAFTESGTVVKVEATSDVFATVTVTDEVCLDEFVGLLATASGPRRLASDPLAYAEEMLRRAEEDASRPWFVPGPLHGSAKRRRR